MLSPLRSTLTDLNDFLDLSYHDSDFTTFMFDDVFCNVF